MFIRFRETSTRLQVSLIETRRVNGRVCHEHVLDRESWRRDRQAGRRADSSVRQARGIIIP
jgi:hypothetical protein